MKKLFFFVIAISFSFYSISQNIIDRWDFESITDKNDTISSNNLKSITDGDYMDILDDGTFNYQIKNEQLKVSGTWKLDGDILLFNYNYPKDTLRTYQITISGKDLILSEGDINYSFTRDRELNETISLINLSFNSFLRGILGIISLIFIAFLFSRNRRGIDWILVAKGLSIQLLFAILIFYVPFVSVFFDAIANGFVKIIDFTNEGSKFLFGGLMNDKEESLGYIFVVQVLPTIVFFSALTSLFYYWNILPKIVYAFAWIMKRTMNLSGPESVAAAGNIFLGQTESPLLVKPYLNKMTMSEMLCLMSGGMATIAGGVLAAYIGFLGGESPQLFAKHLLTASVMSAPAAIVASKILFPEKEKFETKLEVSKNDIGSNALEAISTGTTDGVRLAVNVGAMLLVFTALMYMANYLLIEIGEFTSLNNWISENTNYNQLSFNMILGYIGAPIVWLIGVCKEDMFLVGQLLGEKTVLNEFIGYVSLSNMRDSGLFFQERSIIIATYVLCGFANFASIGIQIGGIGALAQKRKADLAKLGFLALLAGTLASLFTAAIIGMLI